LAQVTLYHPAPGDIAASKKIACNSGL